MKILLVSSSSGGHVFPCKALGDYLKNKNEQITYLGIKGEIEEQILHQENLLLLNIPKSFKKAIKNPLSLIKEKENLRKIVDNNDVVVCFGGFITFFVTYFSKPKVLFIHEQNFCLGDSNKLCIYKAKKVFLSFENDRYYSKKFLLVGNPSSQIINSKTFSFHKPMKILFVFGSLGSSILIKKTIEFLKQNKDNNFYTVVNPKHIFEEKINHVNFKEYENVRDVYFDYDLVFSRGGATTLMELMKRKVNTVCIPSVHVKHNHQMQNALYFKKEHDLVILEEKDYCPSNIRKMIDQYSNEKYCLNTYQNMNKINHFNTCDMIYDQIHNYDKKTV